MKFRNLLQDEITLRYKNPNGLLDMVLNESQNPNILNPAYNKEYAEFLDKVLPRELKYCDFKSEGKSPMVPILLGLGGVGSNLAYGLQHVKIERKEDGNIFNLEAFEYDTLEISNLPRFPVLPSSVNKRESLPGLITPNKKMGNILEPAYLAAMYTKEINNLPVGAPDIKTRNYLYDIRIPYLCITHKDDSLTITLTPKPVDENLATESYGMIDVNFLLPAVHMASLYIHEITFNENNPVYKRIEHLRDVMFKITDTVLFLDDPETKAIDKDILGETMFFAKTRSKYFERVYESTKDNNLDEKELMLLINDSFRIYYNKIFDPVGYRDLIESSKLDPAIADQCIEACRSAYEEFNGGLWEENTDLELLTIRQEDVDAFLKMSSPEEVKDYLLERSFKC